jgi:uncharacterized protein YgbK (DUF1537 family)
MMPAPAGSFGMIADDLTGACDAGVQFAARSFSTLVWLAPAAPPPADLLVLVTESRSVAPSAAREAAGAACRRLCALRRTILFLKIDSTFRGNPGAEIQAVMEEAGFLWAVVSPAFPEMGRTVERGRLHVAGAEAAVHLAAHLAGQGVQRVIELEAGRYDELLHLAGGGPAVVVADARSRTDLERLAAVILSFDFRLLPAGSAGLATEIAARLAPASSPAKRPAPQPAAPPGPVLLVVGSTHPVTQAQLAELRQAGAAVASVDEPTALEKALREGKHAVVPADPWRTRPQEAAALPEIVRAGRVRGLVLSGGDTALLVLRAVSAQGIRLERQIRLGIPFGRLVGGALDGLPVATKAGGFGAPDALVYCAGFLSRLPPIE